jgi:hypothetical protein
MFRLSWNLGKLNRLEPSGPVQTCTGIALPLHFKRHDFLADVMHSFKKFITRPNKNADCRRSPQKTYKSFRYHYICDDRTWSKCNSTYSCWWQVTGPRTPNLSSQTGMQPRHCTKPLPIPRTALLRKNSANEICQHGRQLPPNTRVFT